MEGSVERLDIRTGTFTEHYAYFVHTHLQSLRSFHLTCPNLQFPFLEQERKIGAILDSLPDLDFLEISIPFSDAAKTDTKCAQIQIYITVVYFY